MKKTDMGESSSKFHLPEEFTMAGFWVVVRKLSKRGGRKVMTGAFTLYYCMRDSNTPAWAKSVIVGALGYLIFPVDLIPDAIVGAGFTDDWGVILGALASVCAHISEEHRTKAAAMADRLLGVTAENNTVEVPLSIE